MLGVDAVDKTQSMIRLMQLSGKPISFRIAFRVARFLYEIAFNFNVFGRQRLMHFSLLGHQMIQITMTKAVRVMLSTKLVPVHT